MRPRLGWDRTGGEVLLIPLSLSRPLLHLMRGLGWVGVVERLGIHLGLRLAADFPFSLRFV